MYDISLNSSYSSGFDLENFIWPVPTEAYDFITPSIINGILMLTNKHANSDDIRAILISKIFDISSDLSRIARVSTDYLYFKKSDKLLEYNAELHPILHFIISYDNNKVKNVNFSVHKKITLKNNIVRTLNQLNIKVSRYKHSKSTRLDSFNANPLLNDFVRNSDKKIVDIRLTEFASSSLRSNLPKIFHDLAEIYCDFFLNLLKKNLGLNIEVESAVKILAINSIFDHFNQSFDLFGHIKSSGIVSHTSEVLISGTPKYSGRLLSYLAKKKGKKIWRFGHGGDRAFFDDYNFSLADLPFCDKYYGHSIGELCNLKNRFEENRMANVVNSIEFDWQASSKHLNAFFNSNKCSSIKSSKTIMYISAAYLSEELRTFQERSSDAQYLEWQIWLLKKLKSLGYKVISKMHPKGPLLEHNFLKPFSEGVYNDYFAAENYDVSCFLFDFGGSAFYEALSSKKGVVYVDMGMRTIDKNSEKHLNQRCEIVKSSLDSSNRYRVSVSEISSALENAEEFNWTSTDFYDRYVLSNHY
jgi:hypothetical protein